MGELASSEWNVKRVYLMMGKDCNFRCRHCVQEEQLKDSEATRVVAERVFEYLEHLTAIRPDEFEKLNLMFWGGEPLLYMDIIRSVVARMGDRVSYSIVSNGELLTAELVEFFNTHQIRYVLSNDGKHTTSVRRVNMLDDPGFRDLFNKVEKRGIDSVISAYNQNYYDLWRYIDKYVAPDTPVFTEPLMVSWPMPEDLYSFDLVAYESHLREIAAKAKADVLCGRFSDEVALLQTYTQRLISQVKLSERGESLPVIHPKCNQMRTAINIDLLGRVHACHNFDTVLGTVEDDFDVLVSRYDELIQTSTADSECQTCECLPICRYGCPFTPSSAGKTMTCAMTKILIGVCMEYIASFAAVLLDVEIEH